MASGIDQMLCWFSYPLEFVIVIPPTPVYGFDPDLMKVLYLMTV